MEQAWTYLSTTYTDLLKAGDPRLDGYFLMDSPVPITVIVLNYVLFVKFWGPALMEKRPAFELRNVLLVYNFLLVIYNSVMWYHGGIYGWFGKYSFKCQPVDFSNSVDGLGMMNVAYSYFLSKVIELLDTIFFVARKKNNQVSNLHVWHHSFMCLAMWWGVKFAPGGHGAFVGFVNSFIHIIMYGYYFLAALGPRVQPFLWWKKYLTKLQLIQFGMMFVHAMQLVFRECDYPKFLVVVVLVNVLVFIKLFSDFYFASYIKKKKPAEASQSKVLQIGG